MKIEDVITEYFINQKMKIRRKQLKQEVALKDKVIKRIGDKKTDGG